MASGQGLTLLSGPANAGKVALLLERYHVGRTYDAPAPVAGQDATLNELRDRLRRAIDNEEFESAATLRDQIKGME